MKKLIASLATAALLASCSAPTTPELSENAPADQYFYPATTGIQYVYSQGTSANSQDTTTYNTQITSTTYGSYIQLVSQTPASSNVLYYFKVEQPTPGAPIKCILSSTGSDQGLVVLQGDLSIGSTWFADGANNIEASVVGRYADYFPPGLSQVYHDVVVVKYIDKTKGEDSYTIRFFARDYGLILEREVLNPTTEVANLQLLERRGANNIIPNHDRWYDAHSRYIIKMKDQIDDDK
ncbi:MAG TPA: hypothetical protein VFO76_02010 [Candidatus Kapabacteria bacterium]|nr:hypothetical protein [Candidatus Kapabacteria bacterium]